MNDINKIKKTKSGYSISIPCCVGDKLRDKDTKCVFTVDSIDIEIRDLFSYFTGTATDKDGNTILFNKQDIGETFEVIP